MKSIVFLVSGGGGNLKFLYLANKYNMIQDSKFTVIADRACRALDFAEKNNIEHHLISYTRENPYKLREILSEINPDIVVTNWHKIIDSETVKQFSGKLVNLHYSLLPAFSGMIGLEPIAKAYEQGCKFIGPTCHLVDEGVDTGWILAQSFFNTDRLFDESVSLMYRKGCLTLLVGINVVLEGSFCVSSNTLADETFFPKLDLDLRFSDDSFWDKVAEL